MFWQSPWRSSGYWLSIPAFCLAYVLMCFLLLLTPLSSHSCVPFFWFHQCQPKFILAKSCRFGLSNCSLWSSIGENEIAEMPMISFLMYIFPIKSNNFLVIIFPLTWETAKHRQNLRLKLSPQIWSLSFYCTKERHCFRGKFCSHMTSTKFSPIFLHSLKTILSILTDIPFKFHFFCTGLVQFNLHSFQFWCKYLVSLCLQFDAWLAWLGGTVILSLSIALLLRRSPNSLRKIVLFVERKLATKLGLCCVNVWLLAPFGLAPTLSTNLSYRLTLAIMV